MEFYCPECHEEFDLLEGPEVKCPNCGAVDALPAGEAE